MSALFEAFVILGFGVGLLILGPLGVIENVVYTIFILFRGEPKNTTKVLLIGTLVISAVSSSIAVALIAKGPFEFRYLLSLAVALFLAWYFVLIPQLIIRKLLFRCDTHTWPNRNLKMTLLRIILSAALPAGLYLIHGLLGNIVGIPSD